MWYTWFSAKPARNSDTALAKSHPAADVPRQRLQLHVPLALPVASAASMPEPQAARGLVSTTAEFPSPSLATAVSPGGFRPQAVPARPSTVPGGHLGSRGRGGATDSPRVGDR